MSWSTTLKNRQLIRAHLAAGEEIGVMFSDIRGFTSYTATKGDQAAWRLARLHEALMRDEIEGHNGILVKTLGDGIMAAFAELRDGVMAAITIQRAIREQSKKSADQLVDVGIGLASGTPVMTETDLFGNSVNLAQRLSALAKGGQILVTKKIKDAVPIEDGLHYIPLGRRELKGMGKEEIFDVAWMKELFRISDIHDRITLVLTAHGTVAVELAKGMRSATERRRSPFSFLHPRKPSADGRYEVSHEYPADEVSASLRHRRLTVRLERRAIHLRGVDPQKANGFINRLRTLQETRNEATSTG